MSFLALFWVFLGGIYTANAASHSLKYFYTGVTAGIDFPEFTALGLVDDEQITYYDSNIERMIPKTEWVKENVGADYWDRETRKALGTQQTFKADIGNLMRRFNQTQGVHTYQNMFGCEWDSRTGPTGGFYQYGYDGEDFINLDLKNKRYVAAVPQAFDTAKKWNNGFGKTEQDINYLTQDCVDWLKKYVSYGRSALERTVAPEVSLLQKDPCSPAITCHVTGFYPRGVMVTWQRNGEDLDEDVELGETVPNEDGTFQTRSHLTVKPEDWKSQKYTCTVQHKTLRQDIVLPVKEENIKRNTDIKIAPKVSLLQKDSPSPGLTCHVTGFYPRGVMVTWQRNGKDLHEDVELGETVPNADGTFQTRSHLTVKPEDWKGQEYTCTVQHKSLEKNIVLSIKNDSPPMGIIIACVLGVLILALVVIGVVIWKNQSSGYRKLCNTYSESSSRSSTESVDSTKPMI